MRSGFRPRNRDRMAESMEGVRMGFGPLWRGVELQDERGFYGYPVNVGVSNGLQMARNLTGGLPVVYQGRLARLGPSGERLTPAHNERQKGDTGGHRSAGLQNGQRGKCSDV